MPTVADQLIEVLVQAGVRRIYGIVGDSLNPVVDAVRRTEGIEWVHVRHEEVAAFAAGAEAQMTGRLAVCAGSCGPGNLHLINGLFDAHRSGAPVLALASHIPSAQIGTGFFQETHPEELFNECSHFCEMLSQPEQMPRLLRTAIQTASGRRGAAVLVLPGDVAEKQVPSSNGLGVIECEPPIVVPTEDQVLALAEKLNRAERPMFFCGAGTRGAHEEVMELAARVNAPVGHALRGKEWIQYDNPFDVGMSGLLGYGACYDAMHRADLVVLLGTDFPYDNFLPQANTVQVDIEPAHLGRRTVLDLAVHGDVAETIRAVLPHVQQKHDRTYLDRMLREHAGQLERVVDAYTRNVETQVPIHPEYVADVLDDLAAEDAVFTVDTGMCNVWAARYITPNGRRRVLGSFVHGSMANALPQAIGAQIAAPERQVISMSGDGGLAMLLGDLLSLRTHRLPVKVVVFNNSSLGMVKLEMLVDGLPDFGTDHDHVDFAAIAAAAGIYSVRVEKPGEVRDALADALRRPGPALVDVVTDPNALSIPPRITGDQVKGFALAVSRTVLSGGVGKMIQLARSNLRNVPRP
ncbi:pyruvate dehydrogenase (quinone) [Saccharopolyspora kobensis]|uniref:Pyruvate dehydrogenase (Quinone) n=1 Tax=Saccharopolyspora kobensis TaxID=146035 RepID=A0A1H6CS47_9PSEU|nr:pyruvate dehydrogenase [Saccharopolyspora kobensis]SEG75842.1 pyruvate dehydrogenase (quinone) [Saccharopolyspora kobensis]SFC97762.1 pyruvate dehydrogenase (quinone) [Saccharopolyspora kobensis]